MRRIIGGTVVVTLFFFSTLFALELLSPISSGGGTPGAAPEGRPELVPIKPLEPATRTSVVIAPASIAMTAIRIALDNAAPRDLSGKPDNPLGKLLSKAEIGWTVTRTPIGVAGRSDGLAITTGLNGSLRITGQLATQVGSLGGSITGLLNEGLGRGVENLTGKVLDQRADIRGTVSILSKPAITPEWRLEPHLTAQVNIAEANLSIARRQAERVERSASAARESRERTDQRLADQAAQRSLPRTDRALANGPRCAARSRSVRPAPVCPICGSKCGRPALSRRSRGSTPAR